MARDGHLPHTLTAVHPRFRGPHHAEITVGAVVLVVVLLVDVRSAIGFSSLAVLVYYAIANASALTVRGSTVVDWSRRVRARRMSRPCGNSSAALRRGRDRRAHPGSGRLRCPPHGSHDVGEVRTRRSRLRRRSRRHHHRPSRRRHRPSRHHRRHRRPTRSSRHRRRPRCRRPRCRRPRCPPVAAAGVPGLLRLGALVVAAEERVRDGGPDDDTRDGAHHRAGDHPAHAHAGAAEGATRERVLQGAGRPHLGAGRRPSEVGRLGRCTRPPPGRRRTARAAAAGAARESAWRRPRRGSPRAARVVPCAGGSGTGRRLARPRCHRVVEGPVRFRMPGRRRSVEPGYWPCGVGVRPSSLSRKPIVSIPRLSGPDRRARHSLQR